MARPRSSCVPWATHWSPFSERCRSPRPSRSGEVSPTGPKIRYPSLEIFSDSPNLRENGHSRVPPQACDTTTMTKLLAPIPGLILALGLSAPAVAEPATPARIATPSGASAQILPDFADLVDKYGPAVVNINTQTRVQRTQLPNGLSEDDPFYEFFKKFLPPEQQAPQQRRGRPGNPGQQAQPDVPRGPLRPYGLGSGFIVSPDGFIVTNAHVVENAEEITVRLNDKREFKAKVIGADTRSDVAVIKVEAANLPTVKIGDMSKVRVGEWVVAIGSPFGFANTVTAGIVSAKSRENLTQDPNLDAVPFIQTDVAVN